MIAGPDRWAGNCADLGHLLTFTIIIRDRYLTNRTVRDYDLRTNEHDL
jgi:hypothetical protein